MDFTPREEDLYNKTIELTRIFLKDLNFENLSTDALNLSLDLAIDRSNVSRILNKLHRENYLIKVQGRPTLFLARNVIVEQSSNKYISSIINDKASFLNSISDRIETSNIDLSGKAKNSLIGFNENESLHDQAYIVETLISYPNHLYNIVVNGMPSTGKSAIVNHIHDKGHSIGRYHSKLIEMSVLEFSNSFEEIGRLLEIISKTNPSSQTVLIVLKQTYRLEPKLLTYLLSHLRMIQSDPNQSPKQFIFLEDDLNNDVQSELLVPYITNSLKIPPVDDRTMKEKVEFILTFLQKESDDIKRPIYVNKNIFSCFAMSNYTHNLKDIENEVRYAVSHSMIHDNTLDTSVLDMEFDDLSDNLLNNIQNVTNRLHALEDIFNFINQSDFYFIPNVDSKELFALRNAVLDYNHNLIDGTLSLLPLSNYVKNDIELSLKTELNTIRTLNVKDIYNTVYPLLQGDISYPDRVLYQLLMHFDNIIQELSRGTYKQAYYNDYDYQRPEIMALSQKIASKIELDFDITLPLIELNYLQSYLTHARFHSASGDIPILLISHSLDIANSYKSYIKSLNITVDIQTLTYRSQVLKDHVNLFLTSLRKEVSLLDQGRGVVIMTDISSISALMKEIFEESNHEVTVISTLSLDALIKACTLAENSDTNINDFHSLNTTLQFRPSHMLHGIEESGLSSNFIHDVSIKLLSESLVFLDFQKSTALLASVLMNLYNSLDFEYSDSLSIRFIHHSSFMIERVIRNEALSYKNANNFIKKFPNIYKVVEENFQIINNQFGITVPPSELVMICEIFESVIS